MTAATAMLNHYNNHCNCKNDGCNCNNDCNEAATANDHSNCKRPQQLQK